VDLWEKITQISNDGVTKGKPHDTSNCVHQKTAFEDELPTTSEKIHLRISTKFEK
jgi:hypothetical protein